MIHIKFDLTTLQENLNGFNCYLLGRSYDLEENGAPNNYDEALKYYQEGFNNYHYPLCEYALGISLFFGLGNALTIDKDKGKELLINAYPKIIDLINSTNNSYEEKIYAKFVTGAYYYYGLGNIKKDEKKAFEIIKECADQGHIAAIYDLGANFYYYGIGTNKDLEKALYYLNIASSSGLPRATKKYHEYGFDK